MTDWGIIETVNLLSEGEVPVEDGTSLTNPDTLTAVLENGNAVIYRTRPAPSNGRIVKPGSGRLRSRTATAVKC